MDSGSVGMLARLHDEAQLAAVLAHEINHVAGHHGIVDYRATRKKTIAGMVLGGLGGWGDLISIGLHASVYGFARDLEQEADDHAGRAPRAARARRRLASHGCARAARSRRAVVDTNALVDESTRLGALFATKLQAIMETKGYTVEVIDPQRINADPKLQEYVLDANRRFDEMRSRVRPRRIKRRIYNAGDEVRLLADYLGVDAIAFSHVNITITPAGKAIVSALIGGATAGASSTATAGISKPCSIASMSGFRAIRRPKSCRSRLICSRKGPWIPCRPPTRRSGWRRRAKRTCCRISSPC